VPYDEKSASSASISDRICRTVLASDSLIVAPKSKPAATAAFAKLIQFSFESLWYTNGDCFVKPVLSFQNLYCRHLLVSSAHDRDEPQRVRFVHKVGEASAVEPHDAVARNDSPRDLDGKITLITCGNRGMGVRWRSRLPRAGWTSP